MVEAIDTLSFTKPWVGKRPAPGRQHGEGLPGRNVKATDLENMLQLKHVLDKHAGSMFRGDATIPYDVLVVESESRCVFL